MAAERALRTLIVDDEPLAIERMQMLCADIAALHVVGTAHDGEAALRLIAALKPDLLLLDIAMPGLDGMSVARALGHVDPRPVVIFCTAFDQHALAAFDVEAVDYVLKPVSAERLDRAVQRVLGQRAVAAPAAPSQWTEEFWVPHRSEMIRVAADQIDRIDADRDYMKLAVGGRTLLLHETISELERRLDPERFVRLHRSTIVRRAFIAKLRHEGLGVWVAELKDGSAVRIGRTYLAAAKAVAQKN